MLSFLDVQASGKTVGGGYHLFLLARVCHALRDWAETRLTFLQCLDLSYDSIRQMLSKAELDSCLRFVLSRVPPQLSAVSLKMQFYAEESTIRLILLADSWFPLPWLLDMRATVRRPSVSFVTALFLQGPAILRVCAVS
jgi:hypothetical protein